MPRYCDSEVCSFGPDGKRGDTTITVKVTAIEKVNGRLCARLETTANDAVTQTEQQRALVGQQGGGQPLFGLATDDCRRDYEALKTRGVVFDGEPKTMPYGTGVMLQDLYGNKLYLNEDVH